MKTRSALLAILVLLLGIQLKGGCESAPELRLLWSLDANGTLFFAEPDARHERVAVKIARTTKVHDASTGEVLGPPLPFAQASRASFRPDGKLLLAGSRRVILYDVVSGKELGRIQFNQNINSFDHAAGAIAVTTGEALNVYDAKTLRFRWATSGAGYEVNINPNGKDLVLTSTFGVTVRNLKTGALIDTLMPKEPISNLTYSPKGKYLGVGTDTQHKERIRFFETKGWSDLGYDNCLYDKYNPPVWSSDESRFLLGSHRKLTLRSSHGPEKYLDLDFDDRITGCTLAPSGRWALCGTSKGEAQIFDATSGKSVTTLDKGWVMHAWFGPKGRRLFVTRLRSKDSFQVYSTDGKKQAELDWILGR
jgi:WD40 repeat protein